MMSKVFRIITMACMACLISSVSFADDWYQVEVIAFQYVNPNHDDIELWDNHPGEPDWKTGVTLTDEATAKARQKKALKDSMPEEGPPTAQQAEASGHPPAPSTSTDVPNQSFVTAQEIITGQPDQPAPAAHHDAPLSFVSLPASQFTMGNIVNKLSKQGSYRILSHVAWRQPALGGNQLESVHIIGGPRLDETHYQFESLVTLKTSKFLHLDVDAILRERDKQNLGGKFDSPADLGLLENSDNGKDRVAIYQLYRLTQSQRVRSNKLYYFDHPLMGLIIKISPYGA